MFSSRQAKLLSPGEHLTFDGCPGLRLEAAQTTRTWTYRYRSPVDGKLRQVKLGRWPEMSSAEAMAAWQKARGARDAGRDVADDKREEGRAKQAAAKAAKASSDYTVARLAEDYLDGHIDINRKPKGAAEVRRMFDTMLGPIAAVRASDLTRAQAFALLEAHKRTPVQASNLRQELGAAWDRALDAGLIPEVTPNYWRSIMRGKLVSKGKVLQGEPTGTAKRVLKETEVGALVRWLPNFSRLVCDALTLYLWTGTRGAEIVAMEASEITDEIDGLWWTMPKAKTKNARHAQAIDLRVPLIGRAEEVVRRRLQAQSSGYLFASRSAVGHIEQKAVGVAVWHHMPYSRTRPEERRPRLPVTHWAPHDLRRTVRTMLASLGCPSDVAESVLGHMPPGVIGVYNLHRYDRERREWLTKLSAHFEQLAASQVAVVPTPDASRTIRSPRAPASPPAARLARVV
jgi:integrase